MKKLAKFITFTMQKHEGQTRKGSGTPYIVHPLSVMTRLIKENVLNEEILMIAVGHDLIEDTNTTVEEIVDTADSIIVLEGIDQLTKLENQKTSAYFSGMDYRALLVKMSDAVDNAMDSLEFIRSIKDDKERKQRAKKLGRKYGEYYDLTRKRLTQLVVLGRKMSYTDVTMKLAKQLKAFVLIFLLIENGENA